MEDLPLFFPRYTLCEGRGDEHAAAPMERWRLLAIELRDWLHEQRCAEIDLVARDMAMADTDDLRKPLLARLTRSAAMGDTWSINVGLLSPLEQCLGGAVANRLGRQWTGPRLEDIAEDNARYQVWLFHCMAQVVVATEAWTPDELTRVHLLMVQLGRLSSLETVTKLGLESVLRKDVNDVRRHLETKLQESRRSIHSPFLDTWYRMVRGETEPMEEGAGGARAPGGGGGRDRTFEEQLKERADRAIIPWEELSEGEKDLLIGDERYGQ